MSLAGKELKRITKELRQQNKVVLCAAIGKLFLGSPDVEKSRKAEQGSFLRRYELSASQWTDSNMQGAWLLTYDTKTYILGFQLWKMPKFKAVFAYEAYSNMKYLKLSEQMHCFEMDDCILGIAFSDQVAAQKFYDKTVQTLYKAFSPLKLDNLALKNVTPANINSTGSEISGSVLVKKTSGKRRKKRRPSNVIPRNNGSASTMLLFQDSDPNEKSSMGRVDIGTKLSKGSGSQFSANNNPTIISVNRKKAEKTSRDTPGSNPASSLFGSFANRNGSIPSTVMDSPRLTSDVTSPTNIIRSPSNPSSSEGLASKTARWLGFKGRKPKVVPKEDLFSLNLDGSIDADTLAPEFKAMFKNAGYKKKDLKDPALAQGIIKNLQQQDMLWTYRQDPKYNNLSDAELMELVAENENQSSYADYLAKLKDYEYNEKLREKAARAQAGLSKWEKDIGTAGNVPPPIVPPKVPSRKPVGTSTEKELLEHNQSIFDEDSSLILGKPAPKRKNNGSRMSRSRAASYSSFKELDIEHQKKHHGHKDTRRPSRISNQRRLPSMMEHSKESLLPPPTPVRGLGSRPIPILPVPDLEPEEATPIKAIELPAVPTLRPRTAALAPSRISRNRGQSINPYKKNMNFLSDIKNKNQIELNHVSGMIGLTLSRIKTKMKTHEHNSLLGNLRNLLQERRQFLKGEEDDDENSDWTQ